jgi:hypothetical protein
MVTVTKILEERAASNFRAEEWEFYYEDGGSKFLWNTSNYLPYYMAWYTRKL